MIRTHITWSGKARDLPRLSQVYADTFPALCGRPRRDPLNVLTPQDHTQLRAVQPAAARPRAAATGGGR
jgi:hypothetical protein